MDTQIPISAIEDIVDFWDIYNSDGANLLEHHFKPDEKFETRENPYIAAIGHSIITELVGSGYLKVRLLFVFRYYLDVKCVNYYQLFFN